MARWVRFFIAIAFGAVLGLLYGWVISPIEYVDTTPETLRVDYKTDYILMVSEAFHGNEDIDLALRRLTILEGSPPNEMVLQAILFAERAGYTDADLTLMHALANALQIYNTVLETPSP